jgi:hypothetical protein
MRGRGTSAIRNGHIRCLYHPGIHKEMPLSTSQMPLSSSQNHTEFWIWPAGWPERRVARPPHCDWKLCRGMGLPRRQAATDLAQGRSISHLWRDGSSDKWLVLLNILVGVTRRPCSTCRRGAIRWLWTWAAWARARCGWTGTTPGGSGRTGPTPAAAGGAATPGRTARTSACPTAATWPRDGTYT